MPVKYKAVAQARPGIKGGGTYQYYARICQRQNVDLNDLCERVSLMSTLSPPDIWGVIVALLDTIPDYLTNGYNVKLGEFGIFSLSLTSDPAETPEKLTAKNIRKTNIQFRPGVRFKQAVKKPEFKKVSG
ncbi:MAG: HU family DNA-binding protein [Bacteroidales bacterium]|nr:HU family DNA-binding protein [Bacteroidales bacterium]MCF8405620.1 HU family DNA-binding protein [Bacteroidales bacterium]